MFPSNRTILYSHQQFMRFLVAGDPCQHLRLAIKHLILAILVGIQWYFSVILICVTIVADGNEQLFMCLFFIRIYSLIQYLFKSFVHFWNRLFAYCEVWGFFTYAVYKSFVGSAVCKQFRTNRSLDFQSLTSAFLRADIFILMKSNLFFKKSEVLLLAMLKTFFV